jgi:hypothetical protein
MVVRFNTFLKIQVLFGWKCDLMWPMTLYR